MLLSPVSSRPRAPLPARGRAAVVKVSSVALLDAIHPRVALSRALLPPGQRPVLVTVRRVLEKPADVVWGVLSDFSFPPVAAAKPPQPPPPAGVRVEAGTPVGGVKAASSAAEAPHHPFEVVAVDTKGRKKVAPGATREVLLTGPSPAAGAVVTQRLDSLSPTSLKLHMLSSPKPRVHAPAMSEDRTGMTQFAETSVTDAILEKLPRSYTEQVKIVPSFRHRTVVEWTVEVTPPAATGANGCGVAAEKAAEKAARDALAAEVAEVEAAVAKK